MAVALILGMVNRLRHRSKAAKPPPENGNGAVDDLATGIRQAVMAVREALDLFGRAVLVDPDDGSLEDHSREVYVEAHRTVDEAEARLPRVELRLGRRAASARVSVEQLREALVHLRAYIQQPDYGDEWSHAELDEAKEAFKRAQEQERRFVDNARHA